MAKLEKIRKLVKESIINNITVHQLHLEIVQLQSELNQVRGGQVNPRQMPVEPPIIEPGTQRSSEKGGGEGGSKGNFGEVTTDT